MEDSSHEQPLDKPTTESKINRRDMAKLLGAVTALSASLGATFVTSAASLAQGAQLKLKFFKPSPSGDPAKAELLVSINVSPEDQRKIDSVKGPIELRVVSDTSKSIISPIRARQSGDQEVTISSHTIPQAAWQTVKQSDPPRQD